MADQSVTLMGDKVPLLLRRNAQAKKIILRYDATRDQVRVTLPRRASERQALRFVRDHISWLEAERAKAPEPLALEDGATIPLEGIPVRVIFDPSLKRGVLIGEGTLTVGGPVEHAPGRLLRWLKALAKTRLQWFVGQHEMRLGVKSSRIGVGDMRSRWGSCAADGKLRFNWRLVLAPPDVMDYVAAHETAHLIEMNHSPAFWAHVGHCVPDWKIHRAWLRREGNSLFAIQGP